MSNIAYLNSKSKMSYEEINNLPYGIFLSLVEHHTIDDLMQTEEGRKIMDKIKRYKNPRKHADLSAIRAFGGYQAKKKVGEN